MAPQNGAALAFKPVQRAVDETAIQRRTEVRRMHRARIGKAEPQRHPMREMSKPDHRA